MKNIGNMAVKIGEMTNNYYSMKYLLLLCVVLMNGFQAQADDCNENSTLQISVEEAYAKSHLSALVTRIGSRDDTILRLYVLSYFKGSDGDTIDVVFPINSPVFMLDEVWIAYFKYDEKEMLHYQECYPNRMMPKFNSLSSVPGPGEEGISEEEILLSNELIQLRLKKIEIMIDELNQLNEEDDYLLFPTYILPLIIVFFIIAILYLVKSWHSSKMSS